MQKLTINKKAHHEIGFAPYFILISFIASMIFYFRKISKKIGHKLSLKRLKIQKEFYLKKID